MLFSSAFKSTTVIAAFDETVSRDAAHGRISAALLLAVSADYGLELPASPARFISELNRAYLGEGKAPAGLATLVQVLHAAAAAVIASGACKGLPVLATLPAWADPAALAAAAAARKAARLQKKADTAAAAADTAAAAAAPVAVFTAADTGRAFKNAVLSGLFGLSELEDYAALLATAIEAARKSAAAAPAVAAPAVAAPAPAVAARKVAARKVAAPAPAPVVAAAAPAPF